jgi:hypothetical protein
MLDRVVDLLMERETIDGSELLQITGVPNGAPAGRDLVLLSGAVNLAVGKCDPAGPV